MEILLRCTTNVEYDPENKDWTAWIMLGNMCIHCVDVDERKIVVEDELDRFISKHCAANFRS